MLKDFFSKLLGKPVTIPAEPEVAEVVTAPLSPELMARAGDTRPTRAKTAAIPALKLAPAQYVVGIGQSVGRQRDKNEDSLFTFTGNLNSSTNQTPFGLYIVADGMGGHQHGEVASDVAVRTVSEYVLRKLYLPMLIPNANGPQESLQEIMHDSLVEAHLNILKKTPEGGTTITAALVFGKQLTIAHVGDSRAYIMDQLGKFKALTRDHTLVKRLEEMGQLSAAEASIHPQRSVLYRALGQGEPFEAEIQTHRLPSSGFLLVCSDGLWGVLPENQIVEIIMNGSSPHQICQDLVAAANDGGGPDNSTAILVRV